MAIERFFGNKRSGGRRSLSAAILSDGHEDDALVAQRIECLASNQKVGGSIPSEGTGPLLLASTVKLAWATSSWASASLHLPGHLPIHFLATYHCTCDCRTSQRRSMGEHGDLNVHELKVEVQGCMRAYVLSIGSELIGGHLTDTNATFLAQELAAQGIELLHVIQVGDDLNRLVRVLSLAIEDADLVICTGGVGPTDDDLTREAIAALTDETPTVDESIMTSIREFFAQRGLEMPERNAKQAWIIPSAEMLPNPVGTAPGWFVRIDDSVVVAMPGVPREMFRMWTEQVVPRLSAWNGTGEIVFRSTNLRTLGIGESAVSEILGSLTQQTEPYVGTYAKDDGVHVRVTAAAADATQAEFMLQKTVVEISRRLQDFVYADDDRSLPKVLLDSLASRDLTLAISEAGSGGRFASLIFSEPSSITIVTGAEVFGGDNALKDALSEARGVATRLGASIGLHIGVAAAPIPQGLFEGQITVGIANAQETGTSEVFPIRAAYAEIQRRSAMNAADVLRRFIANA